MAEVPSATGSLRRAVRLAVIGVLAALWFPFAISAADSSADHEVTAPAHGIAGLLPARLSGLSAGGDATGFFPEQLEELVSDTAPIFREYHVLAAASRQYGRIRVDLFETRNPYSAFGLFSYHTGDPSFRELEGPGSGAGMLSNGIVFWKGVHFVSVHQTSRGAGGFLREAAFELASLIADAPANPPLPSLLEVLPRSPSARNQRYFLGPESLNQYLDRGREMFGFAGDAEAVMAEYERPASDGQEAGASTRLFVVEYHTPQFAHDAYIRAMERLELLQPEERDSILLKREGNFIVKAVDFTDREFAGGLIDSIEYPYTVKWLRNPLWPTTDPFHTQKAAQLLVSTFELLGLMLVAVLAGGTLFGATIFLKRRRRQEQAFSDAGGMLRLDIEPFEARILRLRPGRDKK